MEFNIVKLVYPFQFENIFHDQYVLPPIIIGLKQNYLNIR